MATEDLKVVLRRNENSGFGFSLLGTTGPPHVIYDIVENSPADLSGAVEAGDVILKVNGTDVHCYTTKEVLKCLRLSDDLVTLELRRDPKLKARIKEQLANTKSPHYIEIEPSNIYDYNSSSSNARRRRTTSPPIGGGGGSGGLSSEHNNYADDAYNKAVVTATSSSPNTHLRHKTSPTNAHATQLTTALRQQQTTTITSTTTRIVSPTHQYHQQQQHQQHSRNSSNSSAKIQLIETSSTTTTTIPANNNNATASPTNRPSRIPQALKSVQKPPVQHSPQNKRPRPSQIPTKAGTAAASTTTTTNGSSPINATSPVIPIQHSNSYTGCTTTYQQHQRQQRRDSNERSSGGDSDPNSAPPQPAKAPRFEAYMMTGDLILNLSRTPQTSNLLSGHTKKVDSLRDSPIRSLTERSAANGALAPRASGESSPTSSSSVESPSHITATNSDLIQKSKQRSQQSSLQHQLMQQKQQQQQRDSINNSYNNSNNSTGGIGGGGIGGDERNYRKDSLTNDTLRLCEEIERDDDDGDRDGDGEEDDEIEDEEYEGEYELESHEDNNYRQRHYQQHHYKQKHQQQQQQQRSQQRRYQQNSYEIQEENEEDQTHYDITNIETYIAGNDDSSDRQCLMLHCGDEDENDEESSNVDGDDDYSTSVASATSSAKQRLRALKQRAASRHKTRVGGGDSVDCANTRVHHHLQQQHVHGSGGSNSGGSSTSSATVKSDGNLGGGGGCGGGTNTSQDETSFSVPTSPISLSTPLIDKETANSVPTSPEPSSLGGSGAVGGCGVLAHDPTNNVVRRHNGIVRKCDSAGFRTSKSEDHLQQIQRDGMAAVIPIDIDEDVNSSLNTLLDTRQDSEDSQASNRDRIIWTYNAPLQQLQQQQQLLAQQENPFATPAQHYVSSGHGARNNNSSPHSNSHSSSISSSPQHSAGSPASPTSVSSSVMSSSGSKGALGTGVVLTSNGGVNQQQQHQAGNPNGATATGRMNTTGANTTGLLQCPSINGGGNGNSGNSIISTRGSAIAGGGDHSVSEAISNISSPDYQDDDNLLSSRDILGGILLSDPSDSDSTILVSDAGIIQRQHQQAKQQKSEHKLVIQVRGIDSSNSTSPRSNYSELKDSEDELITATLTDDPSNTIIAATGTTNENCANNGGKDSSPPVSDDGSDVESLHSYHYSPKAVDMPSAIRLAKRLYSLDGFKKSDVSRHLSKNNDFSRAVADEYLKYFNFEQKTLDQSLREFLQQFSLSGETQERERVLVHFSKRFLDCNPGSFNSQDAVHTLTCAIMLLNTDLHGQNIGRKMTCAEFVENLAELNDGENFPKDVLKYLYQAIKTQPLEWALDDDATDIQKQRADSSLASSGSANASAQGGIGQNPFLDLPESSTAVEYKKGYVMRKCCYDSNFKKTPFGKRSWKMFYCTLRDLVLFLHKDEHGFRKNQMSDNLHNAIRIHHALATKANDYTKKQHVFRLQTADQAEYLFQTSDSKELQSWIETINFVCAAYSAPPLEGGVGSQKRFQRPLLPSTHTKHLLKEQLESHEQQLAQLEHALSEHKKGPVPNKGLPLQNYKEKENYLQYEIRRYKAYVSILNAKILADQQQQLLELQQQQQQLTINPINDEQSDAFPPLSGSTRLQGQTTQQQQQQTNSIISQQQPQSQESTMQNHSQQPQQQQQQSSRKKDKKDKKEKKEKKEKKKK